VYIHVKETGSVVMATEDNLQHILFVFHLMYKIPMSSFLCLSISSIVARWL